ncbi:hypothetical protein Gotur_033030 [Gossypium turneri]
MWEDRYDYIPTREPIIVLELACMPEYMPWFRIHGKLYLLSVEERQRQLRVQRERRGPLNPRQRDDDVGPSTRLKHSPGPSLAAIQSPGPARAPTQSPDPTVQPMIPTTQPFQMMPGAYPSPFMYLNPYMFPFPSRGIARGAVGELFFLPIPISVWVSNTVAVVDANTSTFTILSRWLIVPTPTTRCPTGGTRIPAEATTTPAGSWTKEESNT